MLAFTYMLALIRSSLDDQGHRTPSVDVWTNLEPIAAGEESSGRPTLSMFFNGSERASEADPAVVSLGYHGQSSQTQAELDMGSDGPPSPRSAGLSERDVESPRPSVEGNSLRDPLMTSPGTSYRHTIGGDEAGAANTTSSGAASTGVGGRRRRGSTVVVDKASGQDVQVAGQQDQAGITFVDYKAEAFARIRQHFGITTGTYRKAFARTAKERLTEGGSSDAFFFYTGDLRFIVKSCTLGEVRCIVAQPQP